MSTGFGSRQSVSQPVSSSIFGKSSNDTGESSNDTKDEYLPTAGIELIKQFTQCHLETYANPKKTADGASYLAGWGSECHRDGTPFRQGERLTQHQANELLHRQLQKSTIPVLKELPNWSVLNEHQQGALLSFAHSLDNDRSVLSARSLLGRALAHSRWYQVPTILSGYHGETSPHIAYRRQEEARLFLSEIRRDGYTVINRSRLLLLSEPMLTGADVHGLQSALIQNGYEIEADGVFGPITQWAVEKFQRSVAMTVTGIADVNTQRVLYARPLFMSTPFLIGSDVREVQSALARMGYAVDVNGIFNPRTLQAVVAFQKYFDLPENGVVIGETLTKLLYMPEIAAVS